MFFKYVPFALLPAGFRPAPEANNITSESGSDLIPFKSFKSRSSQSEEPELLRSAQETLTQHKGTRAQNKTVIREKAEYDFQFCPCTYGIGMVVEDYRHGKSRQWSCALLKDTPTPLTQVLIPSEETEV